MNLAYVMDEVGDALEFIAGLRVFRYPADAPVPPCAVVTYPDDLNFDDTYARGSDRMTLPVVLAVGRVTDRAARDLLARYCDGTGSYSVKAAIEAYTFDSCDSVRVQSIEFDTFVMGGADLIGATFSIDVIGTGTI